VVKYKPILLELYLPSCEKHLGDRFLVDFCSGWKYIAVPVPCGLGRCLQCSQIFRPTAYLSYANLSNANLSYADLSNANLYNADLSNANLSNANLSNANLYNADLSNANLSYADLSNANLSYAKYNKLTIFPKSFDERFKEKMILID